MNMLTSSGEKEVVDLEPKRGSTARGLLRVHIEKRIYFVLHMQQCKHFIEILSYLVSNKLYNKISFTPN